ncbi:MAG: recombinase RecA [Halobacteria archaeon]|nr:recombinase RecA [Halobacteria archaeon]
MTYKLGVDKLDQAVGEIDPGSNILVMAPPMEGIKEFEESVVSYAVGEDEGVIYVATEDSGDKVVSRYDGVSGYDPDSFGVVDCVSKDRGREESEHRNVHLSNSPSDLTGIGINVSQFLDEFWNEKGIERNIIYLNSVSTLLMYSDLQTVFKFLHVFTGRVDSVEGLGLFIIDPEMHEQQAYSTLKPLFDGMVELRQGDEGKEIRAKGLSSSPTDWMGFE